MLLSRHQNAGQNDNIKIGNRSFEKVAQCSYLATAGKVKNKAIPVTGREGP
jgi:hypothetical protein